MIARMLVRSLRMPPRPGRNAGASLSALHAGITVPGVVWCLCRGGPAHRAPCLSSVSGPSDGNYRSSSSYKLPLDDYHRVASITLEGLQDAFEQHADDQPAEQIDVEYAEGVLNVAVGNHGTFVLNKQTPNLQIWLSSPVTGPHRYDYCGASASWLNSRDQHELCGRVEADFNRLLDEQSSPISLGELEESIRSALE
jgi:frataxin